MEQTIAMQSITRSRFDHSKICTVYQETAQFPKGADSSRRKIPAYLQWEGRTAITGTML